MIPTFDSLIALLQASQNLILLVDSTRNFVRFFLSSSLCFSVMRVHNSATCNNETIDVTFDASICIFKISRR